MSANFHTAIPDPMNLTSTNIELPLSELDQAITDTLAGGESFSQLNLGSFNAKTISSGAITGDKTLITVDTEASAATDDLDTISSPANGDVIFLKIANDARSVVIRHLGGGTGNIKTQNGKSVILSDTDKIATLIYNGSNWIVLPDVNQTENYFRQTATIASGVITYTSAFMVLDTEASAATDDLTTINSGVDGAILYLTSTSDSRDIVVKHGTGNIYLGDELDITLDTTNKFLLLIYDATNTRWKSLKTNSFVTLNATQGNVSSSFSKNTYGVPYNLVVSSSYPLASSTTPFLDVLPATGQRQVRVLTATDTTLEGYGFGTLTVSGTPSNNYGAGGSVLPGSFVRFQSGASSGNLGGVISPFLLTSIDCYPTLRIFFRTYSSIAVCRFWIGLSSAAIGNTDSPSSAGTHFIGVRYSTVVPDSFWQFVTSDGSTTTASSTAVAAATNSTYELVIYTASSNSSSLYFRNTSSSTYASLTTNTTLPADLTALGLNARVETREAVAKSLQIHTVALYH